MEHTSKNINPKTIVDFYIKQRRLADDTTKRILKSYTASLLSYTEDELENLADDNDHYAFLEREIPKFLKNQAPDIIANNLPHMQHVKQYCNAFCDTDQVHELIQKQRQGEQVNINQMLNLMLKTFKSEYNAPYLEYVTGTHRNHDLKTTVHASVNSITRKVSFDLPKEFTKTVLAQIQPAQKLLSLSDIQEAGWYNGTDLWYDDTKLEELDTEKWYQICVDKSGTIPIDTANDLLHLTKRAEHFYDKDNTIVWNGQQVDTFYIYTKTHEYIGTFRKHGIYSFSVFHEDTEKTNIKP